MIRFGNGCSKTSGMYVFLVLGGFDGLAIKEPIGMVLQNCNYTIKGCDIYDIHPDDIHRQSR